MRWYSSVSSEDESICLSTPNSRPSTRDWGASAKVYGAPGVRRVPSFGLEDPAVIRRILAHLDAKVAAAQAARQPSCRALPARLFG
jgi:hypothetical protein